MTVLALLVTALRLVAIQAVDASEYAERARKQRERALELPAPRGSIFDRSGLELAMSVPSRTVFANPMQIKNPTSVARSLARLLPDIDVPGLTVKLGDKDRGFVYVSRRVDVETGDKIQAWVRKNRIEGVGVMSEPTRVYPGGRLAANILGFAGVDGEGLAGMEQSFEHLLAGKPGYLELEQDRQGRRIPNGHYLETAPVPGSDLTLTIDRAIQYAAEKALAHAVEVNSAKGGTVVVLDPATGDILAMASNPTFDPNDSKTWKGGALRNRAITDVFEPGSVSKLVTVSGALQDGTVTPNTMYSVPSRINYGGGTFSDAHGHGAEDMSVTKIVTKSSNVGTIKIAIAMGADRMDYWLEQFGYGVGTRLGLPGESAGIRPSAKTWNTSLPTMAMGQGVSATSLQLARMFATIANDGVETQPRLLKSWVDADGTSHAAADGATRRVVSAEVADQMTQILMTVTQKGGTGTLAAVPGYNVAGKTGTAQKAQSGGGYRGYMASFYGFLPASNPQLVIGVTLDEPSPYYGGVVAAPAFAEIAKSAVRILRIPTDAGTLSATP